MKNRFLSSKSLNIWSNWDGWEKYISNSSSKSSKSSVLKIYYNIYNWRASSELLEVAYLLLTIFSLNSSTKISFNLNLESCHSLGANLSKNYLWSIYWEINSSILVFSPLELVSLIFICLIIASLAFLSLISLSNFNSASALEALFASKNC